MLSKFDQIFELIKNSFPQNEYRTYENQKKLLEKKEYKIIVKENTAGDIIAFASLWSMNEFNFIEHIAVSAQCRGMGMGTKLMQEIIKNASLPIILEIEIPCDEITNKRLRFYEKLGFNLNKYEYYQLPLRENDKPMKMYLMSYPDSLSKFNFEKIKEEIYHKIYNNDIK